MFRAVANGQGKRGSSSTGIGGGAPIPDPVGLPAAEAGSFTLYQPTTVRYGAGVNFNESYLPAGTYTCGTHNALGDPSAGQVKTCTFQGYNPPPPLGIPADEGEAFTVYETTTIRFGNAGGTEFADSVLAPGDYVCGPHYGGADPAPFQFKFCTLPP